MNQEERSVDSTAEMPFTDRFQITGFRESLFWGGMDTWQEHPTMAELHLQYEEPQEE